MGLRKKVETEQFYSTLSIQKANLTGHWSCKEKTYLDNSLSYIGKEANNTEEQPLDVEKPQVFINEEEIKNFILAQTPAEARKIGISRSEPYYLKKNVMEGKLNLIHQL